MDEDEWDLDLADFIEVRRRVVDPVVAALMLPGEVTAVDVVSQLPANLLPRYARMAHRSGEVWLVLQVGEETFLHWFGERQEPATALATAERLADCLEDFVAESRFGWGQQRRLPAGFRVPPPARGIERSDGQDQSDHGQS